MNVPNNYNSSKIKVLKGLAAVRKRPGMYIGETNKKGLHHLIYEILDNSVDEALAKHCDDIKIIFHKEDNSIEIRDNGRGVPVDIHEEEGISAATLVFTTLHAGGKFDGEDDSYKVSGGLHGVGASVTNALSRYLELTVYKDGFVYFQRFEKGDPVEILKMLRPMTADERNGTTVRFSPDPEMFPEAFEEEGDVNLDAAYIMERVKRTSYLTKKLHLSVDDGSGNIQEFYSENGIIDLVADTTEEIIADEDISFEDGEPKIMGEIVYMTGGNDAAEAEIALAFVNKSYKYKMASFANNIFTEQGGTHVQGFERSITKIVNDYAAKLLTEKLDQPFTKEDILEGANVVISLRIKEPKFSDQTKKKLSAGEGQKVVYALVKEELETYFDKNPDFAQALVMKTFNSKKLREKLEKERNKVRKELNVSRFGGLPGKLADCQSKDPELSELFLVEGDSAGGSAKQGRNRVTQAILPLKGKILNTSKSDDDKIERSDEVKALITVLRTDCGDNFNYEKLRYKKIIIMTDADVDGSHISVLLLTFFMNKMPELIKQGNVYLAMPPLYVLKKKNGKYQYVLNDADLLEKFPNGHQGYEKQRFKGLGEMNPEQLWETTMNPETRSLMKVDYKEEHKEDILSVIEDLMGQDVDRRRAFITENATKANIDI